MFAEENMKAQQDKMQQETKESTQGAQDMAQAKAKMLGDIKTAVGIISTKGSADEAAAYKQLMVQAAENVANAAKEGGFMGIGGVLVNDAEKQAISEISAAVNAPVTAPATAPTTEAAPTPDAPPANDSAAPAA